MKINHIIFTYLFIGFGCFMGLSACQKKPETTPPTTQKEEMVSMSAVPADHKNDPMAIPINDTASKEDKETAESGAMASIELSQDKDSNDNSAMENISENDQVIDHAPASPNAPTAKNDS